MSVNLVFDGATGQDVGGVLQSLRDGMAAQQAEIQRLTVHIGLVENQLVQQQNMMVISLLPWYPPLHVVLDCHMPSTFCQYSVPPFCNSDFTRPIISGRYSIISSIARTP